MRGPGDNNKVGAAWVFIRSAESWAQHGAKLTGTAETGPGEFGLSVALSSEPATTTTALLGGWKDNTEIGASWVFLRSGTTWTQQGEKLVGSGESGGTACVCGKGEFGYSVALSSDGNTALIGGQVTLGF